MIQTRIHVSAIWISSAQHGANLQDREAQLALQSTRKSVETRLAFCKVRAHRAKQCEAKTLSFEIRVWPWYNPNKTCDVWNVCKMFAQIPSTSKSFKMLREKTEKGCWRMLKVGLRVWHFGMPCALQHFTGERDDVQKAPRRVKKTCSRQSDSWR